MKEAHILLVEDNEGDIVLTLEALRDWRFCNKVSVVKTGKDALDFVFQREIFEDQSPPDLILLDINLPLKNGHEVLRAIKSDETTSSIPVIILSTSSAQNDVDKSYKYHANCFITKPVEMDDFFLALSTIEDFWINLVKLPNRKNK